MSWARQLRRFFVENCMWVLLCSAYFRPLFEMHGKMQAYSQNPYVFSSKNYAFFTPTLRQNKARFLIDQKRLYEKCNIFF
jgi:hypothetical protein